MSVEGKVVIVTGGASGIGKAGAELLASKGATIVVADRNEAAAKAAAKSIGQMATAFGVDVGNGPAVRNLVDDVVARYGRVDGLVHSAGVCPRKPFLEMTDADWHDTMSINLDGSFFVTQAVARQMVKQKGGTMVLITSDRGIYGSIDYCHYAATKGGAIALVKSLAQILGGHGITINGINPGLTDTPLGRASNVDWEAKMQRDVLGTVSKPEEIAEIILFLTGTAGKFMTGQIVGNRMRHGT